MRMHGKRRATPRVERTDISETPDSLTGVTDPDEYRREIANIHLAEEREEKERIRRAKQKMQNELNRAIHAIEWQEKELSSDKQKLELCRDPSPSKYHDPRKWLTKSINRREERILELSHKIIQLADALNIEHPPPPGILPAEPAPPLAAPAPLPRKTAEVPPQTTRYQQLIAIVERREPATRGKRRTSEVSRPERLDAARAAVLERCKGRCENPDCAGQPSDTTDAGLPILDVDHVEDIAKGGRDHPVSMVALCPNCHAMKTRGRRREELRQTLREVASRAHAAAWNTRTD